MRCVLLLSLIITSYSYSMEEDSSKKVEEYQVIRAKANPTLAKSFNQFDKKWNQLQKKSDIKKKNKKLTTQISKLALWGVKNLLPEELAYHIAYYRLKKDIPCVLCPNNIIKLIFSVRFRNVIQNFIANETFNRDAISCNKEELKGYSMFLQNGTNYYKPRFQLEYGVATGKIIFSDHKKESYFYLGEHEKPYHTRQFFDGPNKKGSVLIIATNKEQDNMVSSVRFIKMAKKFNFYCSEDMAEISACALHDTHDTCAIANTDGIVHIFELDDKHFFNKAKILKLIGDIIIYSPFEFKKLCFITFNTLWGITHDENLVTIALPKKRQNYTINIIAKNCIFAQHFFINKRDIRIPLNIKDFSVNTVSRHQVIILASTKDVQNEQKNQIFYVNLKNPGRFACLYNDAQDIENVFFSENKIGLLENVGQGKKMNIQAACFIPYQQGLRLLYPHLFMKDKSKKNKRKFPQKKKKQ